MDQQDPKAKELTSTSLSDRFNLLRGILSRNTQYADDLDAPPVDLKLLRRFLADETTAEEEQQVEEMLLTYRPWVQAISLLEREIPQRSHDDPALD